MSAGGDVGRPVSISVGPGAGAFAALVGAVIAVAPVVEMSDCSARIFDVVAAGLDPRDS